MLSGYICRSTAVFNQGDTASWETSGNVWRHLGLSQRQGKEIPLAWSEQSPGMLLNVLQRTGQPPNKERSSQTVNSAKVEKPCCTGKIWGRRVMKKDFYFFSSFIFHSLEFLQNKRNTPRGDNLDQRSANHSPWPDSLHCLVLYSPPAKKGFFA